MTNPRQDKLIQLVNDKGYYGVEELAELLDVSTQTIRRDIKKLSNDRLVIRHHGGASSPATKNNLDYEVRKVSDTDQKHAIGQAIADMIPDGSTVFITIGTTAEIIASHLANKTNLQVITNSLRVASVLHTNKSMDVLIPSGKVKAFNGGIVGTEAMDFISNFRFDYLITSAASIDVDGTLLEYDLNETLITQTVMKSSRHVLVAMDSSKFIPKGSITLANIQDVTCFFTDTQPSPSIEAAAKQGETELVICS
ncbi:DeoR family transcriptional regulator [Vibrio parahaemolyticus]|uniref:DeoR/GlpR family DNA-binding transcription regulator n=1 Tax=Vibrio sp. dhg TaxID=2163016 RepID=UPI000E47CA66|nr:DeoR/GlpR family DNA-binding transcription regulator [Vibrio sp. dhg]AXT73724.1 DeoR family transcriptional regulator [Vibrio sp. dhg]TBT04050.1 DeoR family transcriptional regulator [Vibrio parahaemolyticus]